MGTRRPRRDEYLPHRFPVRLAAESGAHRYLDPYLKSLLGGSWVQPWKSVAFVCLDDLADACRIVLSCVRLRLVGTNANDFPVTPAALGGEHYTIRLVVAVHGTRSDPTNVATNAYLTRVRHRYALAKGRLQSSGTRVVHMHPPTVRGTR